MGSRTVDYVQDQPLLLGALGVTVGAVLGLMVPSSRHERRLVGAMRENFGETARLAVGEAGERVARVAGTVVDTAQEAARREGFERTDATGLGVGRHASVSPTWPAGRVTSWRRPRRLASSAIRDDAFRRR